MTEPLTEEQRREVARRDFNKSAENYVKLLGLLKEEEKKYLQIKLGFVGILGVIFTIILNPANNFESGFKFAFIVTLSVAVLLLIVEIWKLQLESMGGLKKQIRIHILKKIRHIATLNRELKDYGVRAEELLINDDKFENAMKNKDSITSILEIKIGKWFYVSLVLWSFIFISVPVLFFIREMI